MKSVKYSKIGLETETDLDQSSTLSIRKLWLFIIVTSIVIGLIFSTVYHVYQDEIGSKFKECNPFLQLGRLHLDETLVQGADARPSSETIWEPYNQECKPSRFMNDFYKLRNPEIVAAEKEKKVESSGIQSNSTAISADKLDWIKNKTIFLIGDSIDRWTIRDMCHLLRGEAFVVDYNHPSSPPPYHFTSYSIF